MSWILINIPLCVLAVAFTVGLPAWIMLKFPDEADTTAVHTAVPQPRERVAAAAREMHRSSTTPELYPSVV
jgi:hypothetical protein